MDNSWRDRYLKVGSQITETVTKTKGIITKVDNTRNEVHILWCDHILGSNQSVVDDETVWWSELTKCLKADLAPPISKF